MARYWNWVFDLSYFAWLAVEIWIIARDRRFASGTPADRGSVQVLIVAFFTGLTAAFYAASLYKAAQITGHLVAILIAGTLLIWGGMAFRLWAVSTLGKLFRTTVILQSEHQLVTHGPYTYLRHPSYTGTIITICGIGLALNNWLSLVILLIAVLIGYSYRISVEEQALRARFGTSYDDFSRNRWRLVPFVY